MALWNLPKTLQGQSCGQGEVDAREGKD